MKLLIVDDEFVSRRLLQKMLNNYGECDIAANGPEALEAFKGQCDGYLIKPIIREKLLETIGSVGLELRTAD